MKKIISRIILLVLIFSFNSVSAIQDTSPGHNKLTCFDGTSDGGYNGLCIMKSKGARGPVLLNNNDGDIDPYNNYSGVYVETSTLYGQSLGNISQLSFNFVGLLTAGSPRLSIPIDTNGDHLSDGYLFVGAYYCNDNFGTVNVINNPSCTIYTNFSSDSWDNWDVLVAENPGWTISSDAYVFIIADDPGYWTLSGIKFGSVN